jgi:hypothetical protein
MKNGSGPTIFDLARNNTRAKLYLGAVVSADTKVLACHSPSSTFPDLPRVL